MRNYYLILTVAVTFIFKIKNCSFLTYFLINVLYFSFFFRKELVESAKHYVSLILIGWLKIQLTNFMKSFLLIQPTMQSVMTQKLTGSVMLYTNIVNWEAWHQLERNQEVWAKDINIPRQLVVLVVHAGSVEILCNYTVNDKNCNSGNKISEITAIWFF